MANKIISAMQARVAWKGVIFHNCAQSEPGPEGRISDFPEIGDGTNHILPGRTCCGGCFSVPLLWGRFRTDYGGGGVYAIAKECWHCTEMRHFNEIVQVFFLIKLWIFV